MNKIKKILNVNVVVIEQDGTEYIAFGKGIGYHAKINQVIPDEKISRIYTSVDNSKQNELIQSLKKIPANIIKTTEEIVEFAEKFLNEKLDASIFYSLSDHLYFATQRLEQNLTLGNRIYLEMKTYFKDEFKIGIFSLNIIEKNLGIKMPQEEAANIAFHIINASSKDESSNILEISRMIDNILQTLRVISHGKLKYEGINYDRFVTHIKFFAERYINDQMFADDPTLLEKVSDLYPEASKIAFKLKQTLEVIYTKRISKEELAYLIIHIHRVMMY